MIDLLSDKKLILVCGSGGVGKTTLSASLALQMAASGKKVMVLTIDPAKRLATSLGLEVLDDKPRKISPKLFQKVTQNGSGELWAMMLDSKSTFDQLVTRFAPSKEVEQKILSNKIYQHMSSMMAGSQEYMAMEKLYEFSQKNDYDLIVIDTPPTTHAIDFLNAPQKMIDALGHSMIHLLLKPAMMVSQKGFKLFEKGSQIILKIFDRITGFAFLQEISEMLVAFKELLGGFQSRAADVKKILASPDTSFILVSACEDKSIEEARYFIKTLKELSLTLSGLILNRVYPYYEMSGAKKNKAVKELKSLMGDDIAEKMETCFDLFQKRAERDERFKNDMKNILGKKEFLITIPLFESDIHDLEGLYRLGLNLKA